MATMISQFEGKGLLIPAVVFLAAAYVVRLVAQVSYKQDVALCLETDDDALSASTMPTRVPYLASQARSWRN